MKRLTGLLLAAAMLICACGCSSRGQGKAISYPISSSPATLDPQYADETGAKLIINNIFEGLVRLSVSGEIIPGIAESWEISDDGLTYTFKLKEGTEWYCPSTLKKEYGDEFYEKFASEKVTAADFVFACRRTADPVTASPLAHRLGVILNAAEIAAGEADVSALGVSAPDDYTLVFTLSEKCPDFLGRLTESEFMPCNEEFFNQMGGRYGLTVRHIICNGPFYVSYWDPDASMTIKANKYYAGSQSVSPLSVSLPFGNDTDTVLRKLSSASLSAAFLGPETPMPENTTEAKSIRNTVYGFMFNCSDEVLKNGDIRKALCSSIDRELFDTSGENIYPQSGIVPDSCVVGAYSYRSRVGDQTPVIAHDTADAVKRWNKGLEKLEAESISLTVICPQGLDNAVRAQIQIWQKLFGLSIALSVESMTAEEVASAVQRGEYQVALGSISAEQTDAVSFLTELSESNPFNYKSSKYQSIIDRLVTVTSEEDILGGCFTAEDYLLKQGVCYPLYSRAARLAVSSGVSGIEMPGTEATISFISAKRFD